MQRLFWVMFSVVVLGVLGVGPLSGQAQGNGSTPASTWTSPSAQSMQLVGPATDTTEQLTNQPNVDCTEVTYRDVGSDVMQAGCFTDTAGGSLSADKQSMIFAGSDEAIPIQPYAPNQLLVPWQRSASVLALSTASTGGSYVALYKDILPSLADIRDVTLGIVAKKLTAAPDLVLRSSDGAALIINPSSPAFSDQGSWLIVETLGGSFVRINLASLDVLPFATAFSSLGSPALYKSQVAVSRNGQFVAIANIGAASFQVYDLSTCGGPTGSALSPQHCANFDYYSFLKRQIPGLSSIQHLRFVNEGLLSFNASTSNGTNTYEMAPAPITSLLDYLGLGDSYTSGEGAFDYLYGTDDGENNCHLSLQSYPVLLTHDVFSNAGGHSAACSGATSSDVMPKDPAAYRGQVIGGERADQRTPENIARILADFTPGTIPQADFVKYYQPAVTTLSVGGDDIGFGDIVQGCVLPHVSLHLSASICYDTYEDRVELKNLIDKTVSTWAKLYKQIHGLSPASRLYIVATHKLLLITVIAR